MRDAAHLDGVLPVGSDKRRMVKEPHAWIVGLSLNAADAGAAPLVVWEGSHLVMGAALRVQPRRGHLWWCVSGAAFGVSCLLVGLRHAIPDVLSFVVANSCLVGALTGQAAALIEERGRRVGLRWPALLTILFAVEVPLVTK